MDEKTLMDKFSKEKEKEELEATEKTRLRWDITKKKCTLKAEIITEIRKWDQVLPLEGYVIDETPFLKGNSVLIGYDTYSLIKTDGRYIPPGTPPKRIVIVVQDQGRRFKQWMPIDDFCDSCVYSDANYFDPLIKLKERIPLFIEYVAATLAHQEEAKKKGWWQFWK